MLSLRSLAVVAVLAAAFAAPASPRGDESLPQQLVFLRETIAEHDKRYEQRFLAQEAAIHSAFVAQKEAVQAEMAAASLAVSKAESATEKRFESVNEFRGQLRDQTVTFVQRAEHAADLKAIVERLSRLEQLQADNAGAARQTMWLISLLIAVASVAAAIMARRRPPSPARVNDAVHG